MATYVTASSAPSAKVQPQVQTEQEPVVPTREPPSVITKALTRGKGQLGSIANMLGVSGGANVSYNPDDKIDAQMAKYDTDGDGVFNYREVRKIVEELGVSKEKARLLAKLVFGLVVICILLVGAMTGVSIAANEATKESHVSKNTLTTLSGEAVQTAAVEAFGTIWDIARAPVTQLAYLSYITCAVDMTEDPAIAAWTEGMFKIASALRVSESAVQIKTTAGDTLVIDGATETGTLSAADGSAIWPIAAAAPADGRLRRLTAGEPIALRSKAEHRRMMVEAASSPRRVMMEQEASGRVLDSYSYGDYSTSTVIIDSEGVSSFNQQALVADLCAFASSRVGFSQSGCGGSLSSGRQ